MNLWYSMWWPLNILGMKNLVVKSVDLNGTHQAPYNYQPWYLHMHDVTPLACHMLLFHPSRVDNSASHVSPTWHLSLADTWLALKFSILYFPLFHRKHSNLLFFVSILILTIRVLQNPPRKQQKVVIVLAILDYLWLQTW